MFRVETHQKPARFKSLSNNIFSTYSQGENRVTSTMIQVLKNLPINVVERFLGMFTDTDSQNFFSFVNQVKGEGSVPDAEISSNFKLLFETKTAMKAVREDQLKKHLALCSGANTRLVYLTPDAQKPPLLKREDVVWKSFADVNALIDELFTDLGLVLSERDQFLLRNLQSFFDESGLLPSKDECVVVAARIAWRAYEEHGVYVCQGGRTFKTVDWLGFYCDGEIKPKLARITGHSDVTFPELFSNLGDDFPKKLRSWLTDNQWALGKTLHFFDVSGPNDEKTLDLKKSLRNDLNNSSGRAYAYTQGHRYTNLKALRLAKTTTDLVGT
jgi:hypothetical protein